MIHPHPEGIGAPPTTIFKFQRPLASSDGRQDVLVYDESREAEGMIPMTPEIRKAFGSRFKFYAACTMDAKGVVTIVEQVADQPW